MKRLVGCALGAFTALTLAGACGGGSEVNNKPGDNKDGGTQFDGPIIIVPDSGNTGSCTKRNCEQLAAECGPQGDGCGGVIECGDCKAPEVCGAGGPSKCGNPNPGCTPKTCAQLNVDCGPQGNGCGGVIQCGDCDAGEICGGRAPSRCGPGTAGLDASVCVPTKTRCNPGDCGYIGNGCGRLLNCTSPGCTAPQICGGGSPGNPGTPNRCGGAALDAGTCRPRTCAQLGKNCGPVANGCGALLNCGTTCPSGQVCGGGGVPSVCGPIVVDAGDAGRPCTGLCTQQVACDGGTKTTLTGVVRAPNGIEPLPNAVVYVPNGGAAPFHGVQAFPPGVACNRCGADVTGDPLVMTTSAYDGTFTLEDVPVGNNIPLVIQLGRWRRMTTVNVTSPCASSSLPTATTRLPRRQGEGNQRDNIPLTAIAVGGVDALECVMRKIGIDDAEFTSPTGTGRIHMWRGDDGPEGYGQRPPGGTATSWTGLYGSQTQLDRYDQMIFACNGDPGEASMGTSDRNRVRDYLNKGGRLLASHYEYVWLNGYAPFSGTARWNVDQPHPPDPNTILGDIDTSFPKGAIFAQWLTAVGAMSSAKAGTIDINISRHDIDPLPAPPGTGIVAPAQRWISVDNQRRAAGGGLEAFPSSYTTGSGRTVQIPNYVGAPQHYTFNTPVGVAANQQCGRVLFSDFHVSNADSNNAVFPAQCEEDGPPGGLTAQERVIEFMLFDLANCLTPDAQPPSCTPRTCGQLGVQCGPSGNGCGGTIQCGNCVNGQVCGGGGTSNQCGGPTCTPRTCAQVGANCGSAGDGCGGQLSCGGCPTGQACGAGGVANRCAPTTCIPRTCAQMGVTCGPSGDGCGNLIQCGPCPYDCKKRTCAAAGANCGQIADNCGGLINCGTCPTGEECGVGGKPNVCARPQEPK
jgi:hypothetical protein